MMEINFDMLGYTISTMGLNKVGHRVISAAQGNLPGTRGSFVCIYVWFVFSIKLFNACRTLAMFSESYAVFYCQCLHVVFYLSFNEALFQ